MCRHEQLALPAAPEAAAAALRFVHGTLEASVTDGDARVPVLRPHRRDLRFSLGTPGDWAWQEACGCQEAVARSTASGRAVSHLPGPWDGSPS